MLRWRLVAKTPEDPKVVETIGEFLQRVVLFFDAGESCEPELARLSWTALSLPAFRGQL